MTVVLGVDFVTCWQASSPAGVVLLAGSRTIEQCVR